jgi:hypothetical protein
MNRFTTNGRLLVVERFISAFTIRGVKGAPKDVLYEDNGLAVKNLAAKPIDAFAIGPAR